MSVTQHHEPWIRVRELATAEQTTPRVIYWALNNGLRHSRIGQRIRVRRSDWHRWHERHVCQLSNNSSADTAA